MSVVWRGDRLEYFVDGRDVVAPQRRANDVDYVVAEVREVRDGLLLDLAYTTQFEFAPAEQEKP